MPSRPICDLPDCQAHYACQLRNKGLQVSPRVQTTRTQNWRPSVSVPPAHYKNIIYQDRPGGAKSPVMKPDGTVLRHKEYQENKAKYDDMLKKTQTTSKP